MQSRFCQILNPQKNSLAKPSPFELAREFRQFLLSGETRPRQASGSYQIKRKFQPAQTKRHEPLAWFEGGTEQRERKRDEASYRKVASPSFAGADAGP